MADRTKKTIELTPSLEDYLETILQLTFEKPVARIRDIARARGVKSGSVSPAMKRLEALKLIKYGRNEYIELTAEGEKEARKVLSRHLILTDFFKDVLRMSLDDAEEEACVMEHHLSDKAMDGIVRFFEFLRTCPGAPSQFLEKFHACDRLNANNGSGAHCADRLCNVCLNDKNTSNIAALKPGQSGTVMRVGAAPFIRQRLLDMGILPGIKIKMERKAPGGDPVWIKVARYQLSLRREEAETVLIEL